MFKSSVRLFSDGQNSLASASRSHLTNSNWQHARVFRVPVGGQLRPPFPSAAPAAGQCKWKYQLTKHNFCLLDFISNFDSWFLIPDRTGRPGRSRCCFWWKPTWRKGRSCLDSRRSVFTGLCNTGLPRCSCVSLVPPTYPPPVTLLTSWVRAASSFSGLENVFFKTGRWIGTEVEALGGKAATAWLSCGGASSRHQMSHWRSFWAVEGIGKQRMFNKSSSCFCTVQVNFSSRQLLHSMSHV